MHAATSTHLEAWRHVIRGQQIAPSAQNDAAFAKIYGRKESLYLVRALQRQMTAGSKTTRAGNVVQPADVLVQIARLFALRDSLSVVAEGRRVHEDRRKSVRLYVNA